MNILIPLLPAVLLGAFDLSAPATLNDRAPTPVVVVNKSSKAITVKLTASGIPAAGSDGGVIQSPILLLQEGADSKPDASVTLRLGGGEVAYVKAMLNPGIPGGVAAGSESAYLVAYEEGAEGVTSKEIKLPTLVPPASVKPAVTSWNISTTCRPRSRCSKEALLPVDLDTSAKGGVEVPTGVLAHLYNERGDVANLRVEGGKPGEKITASSKEFFESGDGTVRLKTRVESIDSAGVYSGKLKLGGSDVDVKLSVSHPWYCMLFVTALGALVFLGQRSLSIYRGVVSFHERARALRKKSEKAKETFAGKVGQQLPDALGYDIHAHVEARIKQGKRDIDAEARRAREPIDETNSEAFKSLVKLEGMVASWPGFADRLLKLKQRLDAISSKVANDPRSGPSLKMPATLIKAQAVLKGAALTEEEFAQRGKELNEALAALDRWEALNNQVNELTVQAGELRGRASKLPEGDRVQERAALTKTSDDLQKLWEDLWILELQSVLQDVETAATQVKQSLSRLDYQLRTPPVTPPGMTLESMPLVSFNQAARQPQPSVARQAPVVSHGLVAKVGYWFWNLGLWLKSVFVTDLVLVLIALALASFFQLNQTYFGHPWGEPKDYIAAFIAGYGSQGLVSILDALTGRQLASTLQSILGKK